MLEILLSEGYRCALINEERTEGDRCTKGMNERKMAMDEFTEEVTPHFI
jgi:hypothetical protein